MPVSITSAPRSFTACAALTRECATGVQIWWYHPARARRYHFCSGGHVASSGQERHEHAGVPVFSATMRPFRSSVESIPSSAAGSICNDWLSRLSESGVWCFVNSPRIRSNIWETTPTRAAGRPGTRPAPRATPAQAAPQCSPTSILRLAPAIRPQPPPCRAYRAAQTP